MGGGCFTRPRENSGGSFLRNMRTDITIGLLGLCCVLGLVLSGAASSRSTWRRREPPRAEGHDKAKTPSTDVETDLDITHWKTIKSKYGWKIKYPGNWEPDDEKAAMSGLFNIYGPIGPGQCQIARCAEIQIDSEVFQDNTNQSRKNFWKWISH